MSRRAIVLDGHTGQALAITRSLGGRGWEVVVGAPAGARSVAGRSKYARAEFAYHDPARDAAAFQEDLLGVVAEYPADLLLPVTDWTIVPLMPIRDALEGHCAVGLPHTPALQTTLSKANTMALADEIGLPIPPTRVVACHGDWPPEEPLSFPVVIKADRSMTWTPDGTGVHQPAVYARDDDAVRAQLERLLPFGRVVVQSVITGTGVGVGALAHEGEARLLFQYRREHEVPLTGGGSSSRISEPLEERTATFARELLRALRWHGVAMIELKRRDDDTLWLLEVNGRFWGSLPLATAAGADFPGALADLLIDGTCDPVQDYRPNVRVRSMDREVEWLAGAIRKSPTPIEVPWPGALEIARTAAVLALPLGRFDTLSLRDLRPGLATLSKVAGRVTGRFRRPLARRSVLAGARSDRAGGLLRQQLATASKIAIVCTGNIIRSAYAGALLARACPDLEVLDAGLDASPGRRPHPDLIRHASASGLDVRRHAASRPSDRALTEADVVLVMSADHALRVRQRCPEARVGLLGALNPEGPLEIADPDGGPADGFAACYAQIESAVAAITAARVASRPTG